MITIISFGHLYGAAPTHAHLVTDLREHFRNPAPDLDREVRFPDPRVSEQVMTTPGIAPLVHALSGATAAMALPAGRDVVLAVGCAGGHHRAPTVADRIAQTVGGLLGPGHEVTVLHRDLETDDLELDLGDEGEDLVLDGDEEVDIDAPIEMPQDGVDFALPTRPRSTENPAQARSRLEALVSAWTSGFQAYDLSQALADQHGLTRSRAWILTELRRLEDEGRLECDDHGRWTPTR